MAPGGRGPTWVQRELRALLGDFGSATFDAGRPLNVRRTRICSSTISPAWPWSRPPADLRAAYLAQRRAGATRSPTTCSGGSSRSGQRWGRLVLAGAALTDAGELERHPPCWRRSLAATIPTPSTRAGCAASLHAPGTGAGARLERAGDEAAPQRDRASEPGRGHVVGRSDDLDLAEIGRLEQGSNGGGVPGHDDQGFGRPEERGRRVMDLARTDRLDPVSVGGPPFVIEVVDRDRLDPGSRPGRRLEAEREDADQVIGDLAQLVGVRWSGLHAVEEAESRARRRGDLGMDRGASDERAR